MKLNILLFISFMIAGYLLVNAIRTSNTDEVASALYKSGFEKTIPQINLERGFERNEIFDGRKRILSQI